jgi:enoyl-CoA hydratase/carnithine racemase
MRDARFETLQVEAADGVALVTLDRPEVHNAFNLQMQTELQQLWRNLRGDSEVRCVVLTGAGDESFCTGIDRGESMDHLLEGSDARRPFADADVWHLEDPGRRIGPKSNDLWKPVIAAVNGMACGGAFYLLGEVEFIIAAEHATFFDPHVTYGMTASLESMHMLQKMPFHEIMRLALLGAHERVSAQRAYEIGLVSEVVPSEELAEAATRVAIAIASAPPIAIQGTVRSLWTALELSRSQALDMGRVIVRLGTDPDDLREGQAAFSAGERVEARLR